MPTPLNFSQSAINRGAELFARYQSQCRLNQQQQQQQQMEQKAIDSNSLMPSNVDENGNKKNILNLEIPNKKNKVADMRKIDKIAENLRSASNSSAKSMQSMVEVKTPAIAHAASPSMLLKSPPFGSLAHRFTPTIGPPDDKGPPTETMLNIRDLPSHAHSPSPFMSGESATSDQPLTPVSMAGNIVTAPCPPKPSNSKIYATCFICHKQLSNQYNLRVHLETHQNVR